jgi:hypothetical protein
VKSAWRWLGLVCGGALIVAPLRAADEPLDPEFLEFLGSVDSSEAGWHDYLAETDVDQVVQTQSGTAKPADPGSPPPANGKGKVGQQ